MLDQATKEAALKALAAIEAYDRAGIEHGIDRVHLFYDDIEGDWLDSFEEIQPMKIIRSFLNKIYGDEINQAITTAQDNGWTVTREDSGIDSITINAVNGERSFTYAGTIQGAANALEKLNRNSEIR